MNWEAYARVNPLGPDAYNAEPVQQMRAETIVRRCRGDVLDVGGGDGYVADMIRAAGHRVKVVDASSIRVMRARRDYRLTAEIGDATRLTQAERSYDTVVLGEILEHLENPGVALAEACRVARRRVVVSLPLNGWADPTHQWRIRLDVCSDPHQHANDPTKGEQIVLTFERGACWPPDYHRFDPSWAALFGADT